MEQFGAVREELYRRAEAEPAQPFLITALAFADAALGRKEESVRECRRAFEMRPITADALGGSMYSDNGRGDLCLHKSPGGGFCAT
jgi:hypothetical protein